MNGNCNKPLLWEVAMMMSNGMNLSHVRLVVILMEW